MQHGTDNPEGVNAYSALAQIYDRVMSHVNYKLWGRFIKSLMSYYPGIIKTVVDISCGTGSIFPYLKSKKYKLLGSDLSKAMLMQAQKKNNFHRFVCADFTNLPFKKESIDIVISLYDSVNYLLTEEDIKNFLNSAAEVLKKNGLLIFDVVTPYICRTEFKSYEEENNWNAYTGYGRKSWFDDNTSIQYNEFHIKIDSRNYHELHSQKIRPIGDWLDFVREAPFEIVHVLSNFSMRRVHRRSERAHFVCRKKSLS